MICGWQSDAPHTVPQGSYASRTVHDCRTGVTRGPDVRLDESDTEAKADREADISAHSPAAERMPEILRRLRESHPDAHCALRHDNPFQLLVATILSAQCTDERVNEVTRELFVTFPNAEAFASADRAELEAAVRPTGFFRQKAKFIQGASHVIATEHAGEVPDKMDELTALPGVARKTANVVLGVAFGLAEGIVVDTHVKRISTRLGLTAESDPIRIERDLMELVPQSDWIQFGHEMIFHGRRVCNARKPDCVNCALMDLCPSSQI